jgi:hypothetical protein
MDLSDFPDEIPEDLIEYTQMLVKQAEGLIGEIYTKDPPPSPEGAPPYYLDLLGVSYSLALILAAQEGQPEKSILSHLERTALSAKTSVKENKKMRDERLH